MKNLRTAALLAAFSLLCGLPCTGVELKGRLVDSLTWTGQHYEPGTEVPFRYYVSPGAAGDDNAVYVLYETGVSLLPKLEDLLEEGVIPQGLVLMVQSGTLMGPGGSRPMRAEEFDQNGVEFTDLVIEEILPYAAKEAGIGLSPDPDKHFIHGTSSGGVLAWYALWYRNDFFHRGFLSSPSFNAARGGEEPMVLVRKTEPRPIRVFITCGTTEPDYYFGDSFVAAYNAASALRYAGYDIGFEIFAKGKHGSHHQDHAFWDRMMRWMFEPEHVAAPALNLRLSKILPADSHWELCAGTPPARVTKLERDGGRYRIRRGRLYFRPGRGLFGGRRIRLEVPGRVSALALSSDLWRLYVTSEDSRFIYAFSLDSLGRPGARYILAPIHEAYDIRTVGCNDLCVSTEDRVLVATQLGVQTANSFGLVDGILPLPGDLPAERVWLADSLLYAKAADGTVYARKTLLAPHDGKTVSKASGQRYGDLELNYSRPHLEPLFDSFAEGEALPLR